MRKLSKTSNNQVNTLEGIANNCSCQAICRRLPNGTIDRANQQSMFDLQSQYAITGTMPQGIGTEA